MYACALIPKLQKKRAVQFAGVEKRCGNLVMELNVAKVWLCSRLLNLHNDHVF